MPRGPEAEHGIQIARLIRYVCPQFEIYVAKLNI